MADLRIGTATSAPAAGTLKLGATDISKIYSGSTLVWPVTSEDPYVPITSSIAYYVSDASSAPFASALDKNLNLTTPFFSSLPSTVYSVAGASDDFNTLVAAGTGSNQTIYVSQNSGLSWTANSNISASYRNTKISRSGKTIVADSTTPSIGLYVSNDYGSNFSNKISIITNTLPSNSNITSIFETSMSSGGKYIYNYIAYQISSVTYYGLIRSEDYGQNWSLITNLTGVTNFGGRVSVSGNGQYVAFYGYTPVGTGRNQVSNDFGLTWALTSNPTTQVPASGGIVSSETGQYILSSWGGNNGAWVSNDYGQSFSQPSDFASIGTSYPSMSSSGNLMAVNVSSATYPNDAGVWLSENYGSTWTKYQYPAGYNFPTTLVAKSSTADVCGIEFTINNSSETAVTTGLPIQIVYSAADWNTNYNNATPTAAYYNYASSDTSGRGLFYNSYAVSVIQPPTGFRVPNFTDISTLTNSPCSNNPNFNSLATAAGTGNWDSSTFTNTTYRGNSGLNLRGYGYIRNTDYAFIEDELAGTFWYSDSGLKGFKLGYVSSNPQSFMTTIQFTGSPIGKFGFQVRFCKDIP